MEKRDTLVAAYYHLILAFKAEGFDECEEQFSFKRRLHLGETVVLNHRPDPDGNIIIEFACEDIAASSSEELAQQIMKRLFHIMAKQIK